MLKISIVIPLYNKERHIARAIQSVLSQTVQNFEIIIIDDGSTDNSVKIVKRITHPRIKLIQQENLGVCEARNKGIDEAKTLLIAFLDADDAYKPTFLETILHLSITYPQAGAFATAYEIKEASGRIVKPRYQAIPMHPWEGILPNYFQSALGAPPITCSSVAIPKTVFDKVGQFPLGERIAEDLDMWLRVALKYPVAFNTCTGATYFKDASNRVLNMEVPLSGYRLVKTAQEAILKNEVPSYMVPSLKEYIDKQKISTAAKLILAGKRVKGREYLKNCESTFFYKEKIWWSLWAVMPAWLTIFIRISKRKIVRIFWKLLSR